MGRTTEKVRIQNFGDILKVLEGSISEAEIRTVEVEAIADTGATYLCLPPSVIEEIGLIYSYSRSVKTANGIVERRIFKGADITIKGRNEQMSVMENDRQTPPLIGYVVLEVLDFVVDPKSQALIPNPANEGKWMSDLYYIDHRRK
ncbi:retropepsin-like domain-containing protein [Candidatus Poribacteria bacterium]|nr:retropepsin-like domain-containing protein [Candidatus Poribacteria bacterium]